MSVAICYSHSTNNGQGMLIAREYGYYNKQSIQKEEVTVQHKLRTNESLSFLDFWVSRSSSARYIRKKVRTDNFKEVSFNEAHKD